METTKVKVLKEIEVEILNPNEGEEDESLVSLSVYECGTCHWRFIGDVERYGYGYTSQSQQTPDFCPMCGREIEDEFIE